MKTFAAVILAVLAVCPRFGFSQSIYSSPDDFDRFARKLRENALSQVEIFGKVAGVTGLVMTKLDGTAKGGVLVALADKFGLPIHAIGVGEQIDDLAPFDPDDFARALVGLDAGPETGR